MYISLNGNAYVYMYISGFALFRFVSFRRARRIPARLSLRFPTAGILSPVSLRHNDSTFGISTRREFRLFTHFSSYYYRLECKTPFKRKLLYFTS